MGLHVYLYEPDDVAVFKANITHNLGAMADAVGIYTAVWRPEELGIVQAWELIVPLKQGITELATAPIRYERMNPPNGWGTYADFVPWLIRYLAACQMNPRAKVQVSR